MQISVLEYFDKTVARFPNKPALVDQHHVLTFGELSRHARNIASAIIQKTDAFGRPIAVFLPKCNNAVASFLGILYSGNCYVPLDVKSPSPRIKSILDALQPELLITTSSLIDPLIASGMDSERIVNLDDLSNTAFFFKERWRGCIDTDPAYIINTSGSTGIPKGVSICHRGIIDYIDWARDCFSVDETQVIGNQAPFHFDNSTLDLYLCFATGATLHLISEDLFMFPVLLMEYIAQHSVTLVFWVPSVLINAANAGILDKVACPTLKKILFAGEIMPNKQLNVWRRLLPDALYANLYGPTEITVDCTYFIVDRPFEDSEPLPIGFPCRNSDVLILNEQNRLCATGEQGELCVRGSSLALGYWNNPEKTATAFTQNPLNPFYPERIYRTGDLVFCNERGEIIFVGRKDFQIKHMGYRIELGEIETAIMGDGLAGNACVMYNKGKQEITLFYEAAAVVSPANFRKRLSAFLPKYMIPTAFHYFESLPKNASGKIDRQALTRVMNEE